ncbi:MAG: pre-peptidase C-terminal domain-containing protein [Trichocoleus desertorum ATA4-8-CV12]|jgi:hypothetical protein|nr:pre-peptidase C-terminal domain-containing protein [Trichocoleus desertorum ATA4-8-CV12]
MKFQKITQVTALSVLMAGLAGQAQAATFGEVEDAGETLPTAQVIPGNSLLESISGTLSTGVFSGVEDAADLFKIFLNGESFSATTVGGADFDTQLFLFDEQGRGIYANDDAFDNTRQSTLPANSAFTPKQPGTYYLGISSFGYDPVSAGGSIFPFFPDAPTEVTGPTGPGGASSLSGFEVAGLEEGQYTVTLTGVSTGEGDGATSVPEPASVLGFLSLGIWGVVSKLQTKKQKQRLANRFPSAS